MRNLDIGFVYFVVVIPLFVLGLITTARCYRNLLFLYSIVLIHTLVALAFHGSLRTRMPIEPVICVFAAAALALLCRFATRAHRGGR